MEKIFNGISVAAGIIGGYLARMFGGFDAVLCGLMILMMLDYLSGIIKGIYTKSLSSEVGFKGILKKILILIVVAASIALQAFLGDEFALREMVIVFYACNEGLSILENTAAFLPYPQKLKELLQQLREK